eukprot:PITA_35917
MAQSRATVRGQRKGKNVSIGDAPPPPISSEFAASNVEGRGGPKDNIEKYPLWKYVTREDGTSTKRKGGGNVQWRCNFCHISFKITYYRVKGHLLALPSCGIGACKVVLLQKRKEMEKEFIVGMENVAAKSRKTKNEDPLPFLRKGSTKFPFESSIGGQAAKRRAITLGPMDKIFQKEKQEELDLTIAFFFYQNFVSFNVAHSPLFIEMCRALTHGSPSWYVPPGSEKLRTTLLMKAKKEVQKMLEPIKHHGQHLGLALFLMEWTDSARHPIINFMVSSLNGPVFLKAVDTLGEYKDAQFIGELFIKVIKDVGVDSCVQIITNNAPVCKAVGMIVEAKYPQVFWTPCIVHSLNLALKSIASDVLWISNIIENAQHIRNFVQNHTNAFTIYKEYNNLSLLKIVDTRVKKSRLEQSRAETMVYVHTNLRLIYRQREEWLRGKTKMWDVFPDDMGLDSSVELALANMDLNDPVLEPIRFDDGDILEGSSPHQQMQRRLWIQGRRRM